MNEWSRPSCLGCSVLFRRPQVLGSIEATGIVTRGGGLQTVPNPCYYQAFIPELAIDAFIGYVLPRLAQLAQHGLQAFIFSPLKQRKTYEVWAVVTA